MFKFFTGTVDELLNAVEMTPESEVARIKDDNTVLNHQELVATVIDEYKVPREQAEKIVTEIQMEELHRICGKMVEEGILEVTGYDEDGPVYTQIKK